MYVSPGWGTNVPLSFNQYALAQNHQLLFLPRTYGKGYVKDETNNSGATSKRFSASRSKRQITDNYTITLRKAGPFLVQNAGGV